MLTMLKQDCEPQYESVAIALKAGFSDPEPVYPTSDFTCPIPSTKPGQLDATARGADDGTGIIPVVKAAVTDFHFKVIKELFGQERKEEYGNVIDGCISASNERLTGTERMEIIDYVKSKMKKDIDYKFIRDYSLMVWVRREDNTDNLEYWADRLDVSVATMWRRSSEINLILDRLRGNAFYCAEKALREARKL